MFVPCRIRVDYKTPLHLSEGLRHRIPYLRGSESAILSIKNGEYIECVSEALFSGLIKKKRRRGEHAPFFSISPCYSCESRDRSSRRLLGVENKTKLVICQEAKRSHLERARSGILIRLSNTLFPFRHDVLKNHPRKGAPPFSFLFFFSGIKPRAGFFNYKKIPGTYKSNRDVHALFASDPNKGESALIAIVQGKKSGPSLSPKSNLTHTKLERERGIRKLNLKWNSKLFPSFPVHMRRVGLFRGSIVDTECHRRIGGS